LKKPSKNFTRTLSIALFGALMAMCIANSAFAQYEVQKPVPLLKPYAGEYPPPELGGRPDAIVPSDVAHVSNILEEARQQRAQELHHLRARPLLYWRVFAERPLPPIRAAIFLLFFNLLICFVFKRRIAVASSCIRKSFWKSLGVGIIAVFLMASMTRICHETELLVPLGEFTLSVLQFLCLCGLAASSRTLGHAALQKLKIAQPEDGAEPTVLQYLIWIVVGTILVALVVLIPAVLLHNVWFPKLGTRIGMWLSMLGLGALVRTKLGRKELS